MSANGAPHPHMDTNMAGIQGSLQKEREGKTRPRGLWSQEPDILSFVLFVTPKIRSLYEGQFKMMGGMRGRSMPGDVDDNPMLKAYGNLNKMFRKFINTDDPASDYAKQVRLQRADYRLVARYTWTPHRLQLISAFETCVSGVHGSVRCSTKMTSGMHMMPLYFPE